MGTPVESPVGHASDALPIPELLANLGFSSTDAGRAARRVLEENHLTNPGKRNIHPAKIARVRRVLEEKLFRTCGSPSCATLAGRREPVRVAGADCEVCGGRRINQALVRLGAEFQVARVRRVLVVGGSPATHTQLRSTLGQSSAAFDLIDGTRPPKTRRARALADGADLIVIWGNTILSHSVSNHFRAREFAEKTVTVSKRGVESLASEVIEHLEKRRNCGRV